MVRVAVTLLCAAGVALGAPPPGLVDWAQPALGARAMSSHDGPLCWGPPAGTFADGLARYCTSVAAAFDGREETFWAEPGGVDGPLPHPSPASPAWLRVDFGAPVRLRGARVLVGTSLNYTLEAAASPHGPWRALGAHACDEDLGCDLGYPHTYMGGYDPTPEAVPKRREVTHAFDSGVVPVAHARFRNTWASLGGYACGDVCLWTNLVFELELWGEPQKADDAADASTCAPMREPALGGAATAAAAVLRAGLGSR